jgi:hypothetical protein
MGHLVEAIGCGDGTDANRLEEDVVAGVWGIFKIRRLYAKCWRRS